MLEMVGIQNVVVEHKRKLAVAISAALTDQVRALGLSDAKVWVSFDGLGVIEEVGQYPPGCTHAEADLVPIKRPTVRGKKKKSKAQKVGPNGKAEKKAFYMCNYWRKKKGLAPLSLEAWKADKSGNPAVKETPEKN